MNYYRVRYFTSSASLETIEIKANSMREALRIVVTVHDITENNIFSINLIN